MRLLAEKEVRVQYMSNSTNRLVKMKPCPSCGMTNTPRIVHICSRYLPWWYFIECSNCHYCGETKLFIARAVHSWNKEEVVSE